MTQYNSLSEASRRFFEQGLVVSGTEDIVFKNLLNDPKCRGYLIDLISGITDIKKEELENLRIENSEHMVEHVNEKRMISDMIVSIKDHVLVLEMNQSYYPGLFARNTDYTWNSSHWEVKRGEKYYQRKKSYLINFDDFSKFGDEIIIEFALRDTTGKIKETEDYKSYHVNLAKLKEKYYNGDELSDLEKRILILKIDEIDELDKISGDDKNMKQAKNKLVELTSNEEFIGLYDAELHRKWEAEAKEDYAKKQGLEQGLKQGLKEKEQIIRKMKDKGLDTSLISEITGLTLEEIENL